METFSRRMLEERLAALPSHVVYGQLTGRETWADDMLMRVPHHMRTGFVRYVGYGSNFPHGGFLTALMSNDLMGTYRRADDRNLAAIDDWTMFLINSAPSGCFGSREKFENWKGLCHD